MSDTIRFSHIYPDISDKAGVSEILQALLTVIHIWSAFINNPDKAKEHHRLRIAVKETRYTIELNMQLLPDPAAKLAEELKKLQEALGALHDLDMLQQRLQDTIKNCEKNRRLKQLETQRSQVLQKIKSLESLNQTVSEQRQHIYEQCVALWQNEQTQALLQTFRNTLEVLGK